MTIGLACITLHFMQVTLSLLCLVTSVPEVPFTALGLITWLVLILPNFIWWDRVSAYLSGSLIVHGFDFCRYSLTSLMRIHLMLGKTIWHTLDLLYEMQDPSLQPSTSQAQFVPAMFMPYKKGPKIDWTANGGLYHRFFKWKLKCEHILHCDLAMLPESKKCKKVIAWSGDLGMEDYDLRSDTIWPKCKEFCKPQANEVRARFDQLTSFCQGNRSVDEWYNAVQAQVCLAKYPPETANISHHDIFWFFLKDEEFLFKTIKDSSVDLETFPTNKVRQLAKKMEPSKATMHHIKQVTSVLRVVQISFVRHQCTDLPPSKHKNKQSFKSRLPSHKRYTSEQQVPPYKKTFDPKQAHTSGDRCSKWRDSRHVEGFTCPAKKYQCKSCHKYGHFISLCVSRNKCL